MRLKIAFAVLASILSQSAYCAVGSASGKIQFIYTYGDGRVLVLGPGLGFPTASCSNNSGFWIEGTHPQISRMLASLLAAKASGETVTVTAKTDNCWYPQITTDPSTYIIVGS